MTEATGLQVDPVSDPVADDRTYDNVKSWYLYIVRCNDGSLYTGITTDLLRRVDEHNGNHTGSATRGAAYTRGRRPVALVYDEIWHNRALASKREWAVKKLSRIDKLKLIENSQFHDIQSSVERSRVKHAIRK